MKMERKFLIILNDKTSGSSELLNRLVNYFSNRIMEGYTISEEIRIAEKMLGHFAVIKYKLIRLKDLVKDDNKENLLRYLSTFKNNEENIYRKIFNAIPDSVKKYKEILTLSNSQTVFKVLKYWKQSKKMLSVIILESQPGSEGKLMFKKLQRAGIDTLLIKDIFLAKYLEKTDLLILGCDAILKNGDIINKVGSRNAAIVAKYFNKPVLVVSSKIKRTNSKHFKIIGRTPDEKNKFEKVEKELITYLVTD